MLVYQIVFNRINEAITSGALKPGERLPSEREMATTFNVSRTSVRESLRALELNSIIEVRPGEGAFIRPVKVKTLVNDMAAIIAKSGESLIYEMLEIRAIIETECAYLAAQRATSADLERMRNCLDEMAQSENNEELGLTADLNFHYAVAQATNNSILLGIMRTLGDHMEQTIKATRRHRFSRPGRFQDTLEDHRNVFLAISGKDAERARRLMSELITQVREEMALMSLKASQ
ncbi:MAG: FadR family transcriptional regulator [Clostridiales bacterium]|nr:FadR family transcriptional regulator [Clostridiales bacterium]